MHVLIIDFQKAYYSIHREGLINIMIKFHSLHNLIILIQSSIMETYIKTKIGTKKLVQILVRSGLRDTLPTMSSKIVLEKL